MDVRLSAEQRALRDAAAQLVDRLGPQSVADLDDETRRSKLADAVAATGWCELRAADDDGTPLASAVETAIVAEELGRGLADVAFIGPTLAAELRRLAGVAAVGSETVVMTPDLAALGRVGRTGVAIDSAGAHHGLVGDHLGGLGVVPLVVADGATDLTRTAAVAYTESLTPLGGAAVDADAMAGWTALGLALSCADLVGVMRGTIELARSYAGVRKQYGTVIGSFQAVQHLLADAFVAMEGSRSAALHAAWAVDALPAAEALAAAAGAKAYCARAARLVCETSIQVHGGIGNTWDCLAHVYLRRALVSSDLFGAVGPNLDRVLEPAVGAAHGLQ